MPQDLPGFYYDAEKNRYFALKGPIPGSSRNSFLTTAEKPLTNPKQASKACRGVEIKTAKLLQVRELSGNVITSRKGKFNFQEEYQKIQASQPVIWKYHGTKRIGDGALEQIHVDIDMPVGPVGTDILLTGGLNGSLCLYEVGKVGRQFNYGVKCMPDPVWPLNIEMQTEFAKPPGHLWRPAGASIQMSSNVSCIKMSRKHSPHAAGNASSMQHVLITTLGSETSGGSVYILNLSDPLEYNPSTPTIRRRIHEISSFDCTVWTADCNSSGSHAVIGTNLGATIVNLETGTSSWVCRCKSDVLSLQLDHTGNIALCGLRNGTILTVDARQKPEGFSARLIRHRIPYPHHSTSEPSSRSGQKFSKQWFELKGNIYRSCTISMPSSISCLASLKLYDQYFLGSSMDGTIKLYDHRLLQRGAVQSYEGNVNSHTRIQLGVDPSERFVMSGGEDCYLRIWSIKSGELLFEDKFMNSVPLVVCWPRTEGLLNAREGNRDYGQNNYWGTWLGSQEGLFYVDYS